MLFYFNDLRIHARIQTEKQKIKTEYAFPKFQCSRLTTTVAHTACEDVHGRRQVTRGMKTIRSDFTVNLKLTIIFSKVKFYRMSTSTRTKTQTVDPLDILTGQCLVLKFFVLHKNDIQQKLDILNKYSIFPAHIQTRPRISVAEFFLSH